MTSKTDVATDIVSEIERLEADPVERASLAAAQLSDAIGGLIERAAEASNLPKQDIAAAMGVSPGRVSQLLSSDGNVRIATLARIMDAAGYELTVTAKPRNGGETITVPRRSRPRRAGGTRTPMLSCVQSPQEFYDSPSRIAQ